MRAGVPVVLVAALARDRTIGKDGGLPWHYPEDLARFKRDTLGSVLVMGRRTMESIGRPLPGRETVVVSRDPPAVCERWLGVHGAATLEDALAIAVDLGAERISVVGGGEIYRLALPLADEMLLTFVPEEGGGDTFFPEWDPSAWTETQRTVEGRVTVIRLVRER